MFPWYICNSLPGRKRFRASWPLNMASGEWCWLFSALWRSENSHLTAIYIHVLTYDLQSGASTPYKRWSKCTMKKMGGFFLQEPEELRGEVHKLFIHFPPLSFCNKFPLQNKNLLYWHSHNYEIWHLFCWDPPLCTVYIWVFFLYACCFVKM